MKRNNLLVTIALICLVNNVFATDKKEKDFSLNFYGFVRGDLFVNSRATVSSFHGALFLYPLAQDIDPNGEDINAMPNSSFYSLTSRLGIDIAGPKLGAANTSAKIEADFGGTADMHTLLRIRHAYMKLDWTKHELLIGQSWHPLFSSAIPDMLNLNAGAPFNPFSRTPQLGYTYKNKAWEVKIATLWQLQSLSSGPNGKSLEYQLNSAIPELFVGASYGVNGFKAGLGFDVLTIRPRNKATVNGQTFKVNERMCATSPQIHLSYTGKKFRVAAKSTLGSSLDHLTMLGGYGVSKINNITGEQEYVPFTHSASWINITYGKKWKPTLFVGYTKNLGTNLPLANTALTYGRGLDIDQLIRADIGISYNLPYLTVGLEYIPSTAYYGNIEKETGLVKNATPVTNHRIGAVVVYHF